MGLHDCCGPSTHETQCLNSGSLMVMRSRQSAHGSAYSIWAPGAPLRPNDHAETPPLVCGTHYRPAAAAPRPELVS